MPHPSETHSSLITKGTITRAPAILYRHLHNTFLAHNGILFLLTTAAHPQAIKKLFLIDPIPYPLHIIHRNHSLSKTISPTQKASQSSATFQTNQSSITLQTDKRFIVPTDVTIYLNITEILEALIKLAGFSLKFPLKKTTQSQKTTPRESTPFEIHLYYDEKSVTISDLLCFRSTFKSKKSKITLNSLSPRIDFKLLSHPYTTKAANNVLTPHIGLTEADCKTIHDMYVQCEMVAVFGYRLLKQNAPLHYIENECRHYLSLKTKGAASMRFTLQCARFVKNTSTMQPKATTTGKSPTDLAISSSSITDPSVIIFNIALDGNGAALHFAKTVTYATTTLPEEFTQRYESFQKSLALLLTDPQNLNQFLPPTQNNIRIFATLLSYGHHRLSPLTEEMLQDFLTSPQHEIINLLVQENPSPSVQLNYPTPYITESLLIRKKLSAYRNTKTKTQPKQPKIQPKLHFIQEPSYNGALLNFF
ncbi:hypothetical protein COTS27_00624 [Spirochaetota bacterium]|nr:hypothetical protein COTS27_00624 [Spirochaetota bacterium]